MSRRDSDPNQSPTSLFLRKAGSAAFAIALQRMLSTLKIKMAYYDISVDPARIEYNQHCIFVFWHENISVLVPQWSRCPVTILLSLHRDAEWLNHAANYLGFNIVRGSSTRGGSSAIRQLRHLGTRSSFAITPDGPLGPRRQMALGPVFLASRLGMPIVPVGIGFHKPLRLNTWDRFAIPRPFSRARVVFGPKIEIPKNLKRQPLEDCRQNIERLLVDLSEFAEVWAKSGARMANEQVFKRARRCHELVFDDIPANQRQIRSTRRNAA